MSTIISLPLAFIKTNRLHISLLISFIANDKFYDNVNPFWEAFKEKKPLIAEGIITLKEIYSDKKNEIISLMLFEIMKISLAYVKLVLSTPEARKFVSKSMLMKLASVDSNYHKLLNPLIQKIQPAVNVPSLKF